MSEIIRFETMYTENFAVKDVRLTSDFPELEWAQVEGDWVCAIPGNDWAEVSNTSNQVLTVIPDKITNNTDTLYDWEIEGFEGEETKVMPAFVTIYDRYQINPIVWSELRQYMFVTAQRSFTRYRRTLKAEMCAGAIIPLVAVLAVGALGVLLANNSGGGRIESR